MFQIKNHRSIVASMINVTRASQSLLTDFSVGSVARTMMESPAVEIEELYLQMLLGLQDAIPVAVYRAFDFLPLPATPAAGTVTITFSPALPAPFVIPLGTGLVAQARGVSFSTAVAVTAPLGATSVTVPVVCLSQGTAGNVGADEISSFATVVQPPADTVITHPAFASGRDVEGEGEQKSRFLAFVRSIARGTVSSVAYAASTARVLSPTGEVVEYVDRLGLIENPGKVMIYLKGSAGPTSAALLRAAQLIIDGYRSDVTGERVPGYRAAGVEVAVASMGVRAVSVAVMIATLPGVTKSSTLSSAVASALTRTISAVLPGAFLSSSDLITAALAVPGVLSCTVLSGQNVVCAQSEYLQCNAPGVIWVT